MKIIKQNVLTCIGMLVITSALASASASVIAGNKASLERCMTAVTQGPQKNGIEFHGTTFNCKPWKISDLGRSIEIKGQISHDLRWRKDDQVNYRFFLDDQDNKLVPGTLEMTINRGGLRNTLPSVATRAIQEYAEMLSRGYAGDVYELMERVTFSKKWHKHAALLVNEVVVEAEKKYLRNANSSSFAGLSRVKRESQCYNMIQGKVGWDRKGSSKWNPKNIKSLCKGTRNPSATISCFKKQISNHGDWKTAISRCDGLR